MLIVYMGSSTILDKILFWVVVALFFLLPIFVIPSAAVGFSFSKGILIAILTLAAFIVWVLKVLKEGTLRFPKSWLISFVILIPLVYLISALLSDVPGRALMERGVEIGTFFSVTLLMLPLLIIPVAFRSDKNILYAYAAFLLSILVVALFQVVRLFVGPEALQLGVLTNAASNLVGKWNDLGVFFGLGVVMAATTIEFFRVNNRIIQTLIYLSLVVSLFFVALVNFVSLWYVVGIFGLVLLVYRLSLPKEVEVTDIGGGLEAHDQKSGRGVSIIGVVLVALSLVFIVGANSFGGSLSQAFDIAQVEVRPSWGATFSVADQTLTENPVLGVGPNHFSQEWHEHKPDGVNETVFWNIDFNSGVGFIPTALVTVGIVGVAVWVLFLLAFLWKGVKALFSRSESPLSAYITASSFIAALYLWVMTVIYIPNSVLLMFATIFTGIFITSTSHRDLVGIKEVNFSAKPVWNFIVVLISVGLVIVSVLGGFSSAQRFGAALAHQGVVLDFAQDGDLDAAESRLVSLLSLHEYDLYYRSLADLEIAKLQRIVNDTNITGEAQLEAFQQALGTAIDAARRSTELDALDYQNWVSLGRVYESVIPLQIDGSYENARSAYEQALSVNPHGPQLFLALARLEASQGNLTGTREFIAQALGEKNNYLDAVFLLSQLEASEGNVTQATQATEAAALLAPNNPTVFFQLGLLRYNTNDFQGAISALERATALTPVYANARYFLGLSYYEVGRNEDAVLQFEEIQSTNQDNQEVGLILENLRAGLDPFTGAQPPISTAPEDREELPLDEEGVQE